MTRFRAKCIVILAGGCLSLSACAPALMTRIDSSGAPAQAITKGNAAIILPTKINITPEWQQARDAILANLQKKGVDVAEPATYSIEISLAARPADLSLATLGSTAGMEPIAPIGQKGGTKCVNNDYRLVVVLSRIADGTLLYKGSASEYHCKEKLAEIIPVLVDAAMRDFGNPKGNYTVIRRKAHIAL